MTMGYTGMPEETGKYKEKGVRDGAAVIHTEGQAADKAGAGQEAAANRCEAPQEPAADRDCTEREAVSEKEAGAVQEAPADRAGTAEEPVWDKAGVTQREPADLPVHRIKEVEPGSIAEELGLAPGDVLLEVNGQAVEDIFDYQYLTNEEYLTVLVRKADGEQWELEIEKEYEEDLGITFENALMDEYRSCRNHCIFCFIDQMPGGMRETLYFKDDDSRLSFLQGNYVTLTNMSDHDIDRIIRYHLEPINISFQTMNPSLRCKMLHNRFAGDIFPKVRRLAEAGIEMNGQIVLCRGVNDGEELESSIQKMTQYLPALRSVSVVPVGLTKFRDGLYPLEPFSKEDACAVIDRIEAWQKRIYPEYGVHFIHASDEWYILAGRPFPEAERYDGYLQLENGVGMMRLLREEVMEALRRSAESGSGTAELSGAKCSGEAAELSGAKCPGEAAELPGAKQPDESDVRSRELSLATGCLAAPFLRELYGEIRAYFPEVTLHIYEIRNDFFGEKITVSGLITGQDLIAQLKGRPLGEELLLPCSMLRSGENVFLDDVTVADLEKALQIKVRIVKSGGADLVEAITGERIFAQNAEAESAGTLEWQIKEQTEDEIPYQEEEI